MVPAVTVLASDWLCRRRVGDRVVGRGARDQHREGEQEGEQHDRRRRCHEQRQPTTHQPGSTSLTPTPRTLCSSPGLGGGLTELAAQPGQVHVDGLVGPAVGRLPHLGEQRALRDDLTRARHEVGEQVELPRPQIELPAGQHRRPRAHVDVEVADREPGVRAVGRAGAAQHGPDPGVELVGAERLDDVVVGAGVEGGDDRPVVVAGRGHDDRHRADRPQHAQQRRAVEVGQAEVEDDEVGALVDGMPQPRHAGRLRGDGMTAFGQRAHHRRADLGVVLDEQEHGHARRP